MDILRRSIIIVSFSITPIQKNFAKSLPIGVQCLGITQTGIIHDLKKPSRANGTCFLPKQEPVDFNSDIIKGKLSFANESQDIPFQMKVVNQNFENNVRQDIYEFIDSKPVTMSYLNIEYDKSNQQLGNPKIISQTSCSEVMIKKRRRLTCSTIDKDFCKLFLDRDSNNCIELKSSKLNAQEIVERKMYCAFQKHYPISAGHYNVPINQNANSFKIFAYASEVKKNHFEFDDNQFADARLEIWRILSSSSDNETTKAEKSEILKGVINRCYHYYPRVDGNAYSYDGNPY